MSRVLAFAEETKNKTRQPCCELHFNCRVTEKGGVCRGGGASCHANTNTHTHTHTHRVQDGCKSEQW